MAKKPQFIDYLFSEYWLSSVLENINGPHVSPSLLLCCVSLHFPSLKRQKLFPGLSDVTCFDPKYEAAVCVLLFQALPSGGLAISDFSLLFCHWHKKAMPWPYHWSRKRMRECAVEVPQPAQSRVGPQPGYRYTYILCMSEPSWDQLSLIQCTLLQG